MSSHRLTTIATVAAATAAIGLGGLATAATAAASGTDDTFISQMTSVGISFASPQDAVRVGRQVCKELASGKTEADIALALRNQRNLTAGQAAYLVVDASNAYCPRLASHLT